MKNKTACQNIKSVDGLISEYYRLNPEGHFFDRDTLKFFGERKSDMHLFKQHEVITDWNDIEHECYVLSSLQRDRVLGQRRHHYYFDINTLKDIEPAYN